MAPQDDFSVGDAVTVSGMPEESGLNGLVGALLKPVGRGRWSIKVEGDDKSKVVPTANLKKVKMKGSAATGASTKEAKYFIVGTWIDWEPQAMTWSKESRSFEFTVTIGNDGSESFKILKNGDWEGCVYPDRKDATPFDDHQVWGPGDGGLNEDWTIGAHVKDEAFVGARYKVKFMLEPDGTPTKVTWENLTKKEAAEANPQAKQTGSAQERQASPPKTGSDTTLTEGRPAVSATRLNATEDCVEMERRAREALWARFAAVDQAAIEDGDPGDHSTDKEKMHEKLEWNLQRYRRSNEEATRKPGQPTVSEVEQQMQMAIRHCVECGKICAAFFGNGVCETCWTAWEKIQKKGEDNVEVVPNHLPAGLRIYLRMKNSQMNAADAEGRPVRSREPSRSLTPSRRKARNRRASLKAAEVQEKDEDWDPFAPCL